MKQASVYRGTPFEAKEMVMRTNGCEVRRDVTITPIITVCGCVALELKGKAGYLRPNLREHCASMRYFEAWRVIELANALKFPRLEDGDEANSLDDIISFVRGDRDLNLMWRLRLSLGKSDHQLATVLGQLTGQRPPDTVLDKIRENLQALSDCNEGYEDFIAECEEHEGEASVA